MNKELASKFIREYVPNPVSIILNSYSSCEDFNQTSVNIKLTVNDKPVEIEGVGVGLVDAGFNAFVGFFTREYTSLSTIRLSDVFFQIDTNHGRSLTLKSKTIMKLECENDNKNKMLFESKTSSIGLTAVNVLSKAMQFYINCEILFKRVKFLLEDAKSRNRSDVASTYQYVLTKVVEVTSYKNV